MKRASISISGALALLLLCSHARNSFADCTHSLELPPGFATISTDVAAWVYWGEKRLGETPISFVKLPAGCIEVSFESVDGKMKQVERLTVEPNKLGMYTLHFSPLNGRESAERSQLSGVVSSEPEKELCNRSPHLGRIKNEIDRLEFDTVTRTLERAVEYGDNCREDLVRIYYYKAMVQAVTDDIARCQRDFEIALALMPSLKPSEVVYEKVSRCFERAQMTSSASREMRAVLGAHNYLKNREAFAVPISVIDPLRLSTHVLTFVRRPGDKTFMRLVTQVQPGMHTILEIPALRLPEGAPKYLEYFVGIVDPWGGRLSTIGSAALPLKLPTPPR